MASETVLVCPACDAAQLQTAGRFSDHDYRCNDCGEKTNEPVERERQAVNGLGNAPHAKALDEMDPEDFGGKA